MAHQNILYPNTAGGGAIEFRLDGADQEVIKDTVTPANNIPLPVQLLDTSGNLNTVTVGASALPTGAATAAKQDTGNTSLNSIDNKLGSIGQKAMAGSAPVVIASDQSAIPASQSGTWNINNVSGTISLPTGASTAALQTTGNTSLGNIDTKLPSTVGQKAMAASLAVVIASDQSAVPASQSGTWNITDVSGTISLPTGASTAAKQDTGNTSLSSIDGKFGTLGQKAMAGSAPVVLASDQAAIPVTQSGTWSLRLQDGSGNALTSVSVGSNRALYAQQLGRTKADKARNDYTSTSVTTAAYVQLIASTAAECQEVEIFDSSGETLLLAVGAAASEVDQIYILPGGNGRVPLRIASGSRVSVKAVSATASVGELTINLYG